MICDNSVARQQAAGSLGEKCVTVYDIARSVGVSHTIVARALRDSKDVALRRREEIQRVALEMDYYPDPRLAALANYRKTLEPASFQGVVAGTSICDIPVDAGIDQRSVEIGRIAMQMLIKEIHVGERGAPSNPCRILVESHWQDGQSLPHRSQKEPDEFQCDDQFVSRVTEVSQTFPR